jgi:hypothetical protein
VTAVLIGVAPSHALRVVVAFRSMPIEPPWPIDVLAKLRALLQELQRQAARDPRDPAIPAVMADVEAAIAKVEPLARAATQA